MNMQVNAEKVDSPAASRQLPAAVPAAGRAHRQLCAAPLAADGVCGVASSR